ncbi:MAG: hypothetical protein AB1597_02900 [Chloroflexota bacterium]
MASLRVVDPSEGHDDYLMSLVLYLHAANGWVLRVVMAGMASL